MLDAVTEVIATDEFAVWYSDLDESVSDDVDVAVEQLAQLGVTLGFPRSSAIEGASFALRELRVQSGGHPIRVFYAFDPKRQAVLLIGGDKTGDKRFYERMILDCDRIWKEYIHETS
jgi:hypothetical protein